MDQKVFSRFSALGLIKSSDKPAQGIEDGEKARLNRKGNELYNRGELETARRVFETTGYSDGLIRVGDSYLQRRRPVDALKMYCLAHDERRQEALVELAALAIQKFLHEEEDENERPTQRRTSEGPAPAEGRPEP
jgi:hypothetical protein